MSKGIGFRMACGVLMMFMVVSVVGCARASFEVSNLTMESAQADVGESVNVSLEVKNTGTASGTYTEALTINGEVIETKEVTLPPGESEVVVFTFVKDAVGTYDIAVGPLSGTLTVVKAAYQLVPQYADFLLYLHFERILNDPDFRGLYEYTYEAIPQGLRPADFPGTAEDALDMIKLETRLDLNDFSEVLVFGDSESLMEGGEYFGLMVEGTFDESELIETIEELAEIQLRPEDYKGYQIYVNEQDDVALTFLREDMLVFGSVDAVKDVVGIERGEGMPISGKLYDVYTSLPREAISKYTITMPEELRSEIREELTIPEIPIDLTPIAEIETMGQAITKDDQLIIGRSAVYFSNEASAHDFADMFEGAVLLIKGMIDIPEVKAFLGKIEINREDAQVIVEYQVSVDEIESLIDGIMEVVEEYAELYPVEE